MLHLSSWTATLPILVIGMVGILLVMGVLVLAVMLLGKTTLCHMRKDSLTGNMVPVLRMCCGLPWECRRIPTP